MTVGVLSKQVQKVSKFEYAFNKFEYLGNTYANLKKWQQFFEHVLDKIESKNFKWFQ